MNAQAAAALSRDNGLYQRGGALVRVARDARPVANGVNRPMAPRIDPLPPPLLRERLAANARWITTRAMKDKSMRVHSHPPAWCVSAVHARGDWPGVRHLESVVDHPVLRPDGTILDRPGYDHATGLLLDFRGEALTLSPSPSHADAQASLNLILDLVADFPFKAPCHRSAWVASLLTPLARFAFAGPAPLFLVDANVRAAGKGLLLDVVSRIINGERFTVATYTSDEDELRRAHHVSGPGRRSHGVVRQPRRALWKRCARRRTDGNQLGGPYPGSQPHGPGTPVHHLVCHWQ